MRFRIRLFKLLDIVVGGPLCILLGVLSSFRRTGPVTPSQKQGQLRRILVIRPGGIGDMILLLPAMQLLKRQFPNLTMDIVCERRNVEVLKLTQLAVGRLLIYDDNPIMFLWRLLRSKYDIAIDTEQFHHFSAIFAYFSGAGVRIGFKINPRRNSLYTHLVSYDLDGFEGEQFMKLVTPLGISPTNIISAYLKPVNCSLPQSVEKQLASIGHFAVIHPGGNVHQKAWNPAKYARLINLLNIKLGFAAVIVGADVEKKYERIILKNLETSEFSGTSVVGQLTLSQTAEVIRRSIVFIGTDSGLAHMALAIGVPCVVLFGPTDENKWGIKNSDCVIVRKQLPCAPCSMFGYYKPCRDIACLNHIDVDDVMIAVEKVLSIRNISGRVISNEHKEKTT